MEFIARYPLDGEENDHLETNQFRRKDGPWYFVDGKRGGAQTFVRETSKVG